MALILKKNTVKNIHAKSLDFHLFEATTKEYFLKGFQIAPFSLRDKKREKVQLKIIPITNIEQKFKTYH